MNYFTSFLICACLAIFGLSAAENGEGPMQEDMPAMHSENLCVNDDGVKCYCSQLCSWRDKQSEDSPVYVEEDENGKHCYCKEWDKDLYEENCKMNMDIPQPDEAK